MLVRNKNTKGGGLPDMKGKRKAKQNKVMA